MLRSWSGPVLLIILAGAEAYGQSSSYGASISLSGNGAGNGVPGAQGGKLGASASVLSISNATGGVTTIPLAFVGIAGNGSSTDITVLPAADPRDSLHFHDGSSSWDASGRSGTATISSAGGAFSGVSGSISYALTCTDGCFKGSGTPSPGVFNFAFTA